ncbi:uncharacterized protein LOC132174149 [Corylus avellana]|uniref:uncharacterized protein LOC132174149 n=1 Tax=Corylus avellana TaxID=13451 RepID=UPI00286CE5C9|nr:uncharacterized protein LOC132174149 [Corylus avellana]
MSGSFSDIFGNLLERCDRTEMELFAVTTRRIWLRRNAVVHGDSFLHPNQLLREAQCALDEYHRVNEGNSAQRNHDLERAIVKWQPPPANMVKMNWDAAVNVKEKRVGLGLIARDSTRDPITAESMAALHAVLFSKEMSFGNVLFEGDAMQVIKMIDSKGPCFSSYGQFIEGIKLELRGVENARFLHVLRDANNAAHVLAKLASTHVIFSTWLGNTPSSIGDIVRREQSLLHG